MSYTTGIYWLTRLDNINSLFVFLLILGGFIYGCYHLIMGINCDFDRDDMRDFNKNHRNTKRWAIAMIVVGILGITFTPNTKEAIFIVAGGKTLEYASKDTSLQRIPGQISKITTTWLEEKLQDLEHGVKDNIDSIKRK